MRLLSLKVIGDVHKRPEVAHLPELQIGFHLFLKVIQRLTNSLKPKRMLNCEQIPLVLDVHCLGVAGLQYASEFLVELCVDLCQCSVQDFLHAVGSFFHLESEATVVTQLALIFLFVAATV